MFSKNRLTHSLSPAFGTISKLEQALFFRTLEQNLKSEIHPLAPTI